MKSSAFRGRACRFVLSAAMLVTALPALAGPNLMAIGTYGDIPFRRAEPRDSFNGGEIVYEFTDPEFDFGRVVVRTAEPFSIVRRDLFVGFNGNGLIVDTRGTSTGGGGGSGGSRGGGISSLEIWLRVKGRIRPGRSYEWDIRVGAANPVIDGGIPAVIPALWADGAPVGVEVTMRSPEPEDDDKIQRNLLPHGVVTLPAFERQTGGAWVVLRPQGYGNFFLLHSFSFREVETRESITAGDMPVPVRYIPIRDVVEDKLAEAMTRGAESLKRARVEETRWSGNSLEQSVTITALCAAALGELDAADDAVPKALDWLAAQTPEANAPWGTEAVGNRLYALSRFGSFDKYRSVIAADVQFLVKAQYDDGGWSATSRDVNPAAIIAQPSNNPFTSAVGWALREARFAGAEMDIRVWRNALRYWTQAALFDGGFGISGDRFGGISIGSTTGFTALGASALIGTLDMSAGMRASNCSTYLANRDQLRTINNAINWLDKSFEEEWGQVFRGVEDAYIEPIGLQRLAEVSGIVVLNGHNHFTEGARKLLEHYDDSSGLFGVRGEASDAQEAPSLRRSATALITLGAGAAPVILQRMIVGDDEENRGQMRGDAAHIVRYLARQRGRPFQWRRAPQDADVRFLAEVPMMMLSVVGRFDWPAEQWAKLREYALAGGTLLIDIAEGQGGLRDDIQAHLQRTFPEYALRDLPADSPVFSAESRIEERPALLAMGNGFREFLFLPKESWSCQWHLYDVQSRRGSFDFMNNLLTYATDGSPPRNWLKRSTYAEASAPAHRMTAAYLQSGGRVPAYPNLVETMDRLMQENFRLQVEPADVAADATLLWMTVAGDEPIAEETHAALAAALEAGRFVFIDVISGNERWDEAMRGRLAAVEGLSLRPLRRTHPVFTGEISGTQGFDCGQVNLRRALHKRWSTAGRCELHELRWKGEFAGVYSSYDLSSGIGYQFFPECRGVMPGHARQLAMNAFLVAFERSRTRSVAVAP